AFAFAAMLIVGCAPGGQSGAGGSANTAPSGQPKRLVIASREASTALIDAAGSGGDVIEELTSAGLVRFNPVGEPVPLLAEVLPDGRMETTWVLKPGAKWEDGTPITSDDLLFSIRIGQDGAIPEFSHEAYRSLEGVKAIDDRTITATWKKVYVQATVMFSWRV